MPENVFQIPPEIAELVNNISTIIAYKMKQHIQQSI